MKAILPGEIRVLAGAVLVLAVFASASVFSPAIARAFPFGGPIVMLQGCVDGSKYVVVGPPNGGAFVWTASTVTYPFGAPAHAGQSLLGLAGAPYACIVSVFPLVILPGTYIQMMGSSQ